MRLVKSVQFAIGFAASSGVVVVLGGSAFADTGAATSSSPQAVAPQVVSTQVKETVTKTVLATTAAPDSDSDTPKATVVQTVNSDTGAGSSSSAAGLAGSSQQGTGGTAKAATKTNVVSSDVHSSDNTKLSSSISSDSLNKESGLNLGGSAPLIAPVSQALPSDDSIVIVTGTADLASAKAAGGEAMAHSTTLRVQPVIMSHAAAPVEDLATGVPSAPLPIHTPVPVKPNSALGHFTSLLANTVVPSSFFVPATPVEPLAVPVRTIAVMLLLTLGFVSTYGLWLRRTGFATAARSDGEAGAPAILFATSVLSGYAATISSKHSPILVMADIKTPGFGLNTL